MRDVPQHEVIENALFTAILDIRMHHMRDFASDPAELGALRYDLELLTKTIDEIEQMNKAAA